MTALFVEISGPCAKICWGPPYYNVIDEIIKPSDVVNVSRLCMHQNLATSDVRENIFVNRSITLIVYDPWGPGDNTVGCL